MLYSEVSLLMRLALVRAVMPIAHNYPENELGGSEIIMVPLAFAFEFMQATMEIFERLYGITPYYKQNNSTSFRISNSNTSAVRDSSLFDIRVSNANFVRLQEVATVLEKGAPYVMAHTVTITLFSKPKNYDRLLTGLFPEKGGRGELIGSFTLAQAATLLALSHAELFLEYPELYGTHEYSLKYRNYVEFCWGDLEEREGLTTAQIQHPELPR